MTTYLLLALHNDGRSEVFGLPEQWLRWLEHGTGSLPKLEAGAVGFDRGPYATYPVGNYSIDVQMRINHGQGTRTS